MLNEKEKDRQEENACSAFNRVSPTLSGPWRPAGPPAAGLGYAGGVVSTARSRAAGETGKGHRFHSPLPSLGWPAAFEGVALSGDLQTGQEGHPLGEQEELSLPGVDLGKTRASCESTPCAGHAAWPRRARRTGRRVPPAGRTPPTQDPHVLRMLPPQTPVRAVQVGQDLLPVLP